MPKPFRLQPQQANRTPLTAYGAGTAYQLTATPALIHLGTADPSVVLSAPGTYLILARAKVDYTGATFVAVRTVAVKLRRTNNTAADLTGASSSLLTSIITALTYTAGPIVVPPTIYTTQNANDIIQLFGSVSVLPTAGSIDCTEAEIVAIQLS